MLWTQWKTRFTGLTRGQGVATIVSSEGPEIPQGAQSETNFLRFVCNICGKANSLPSQEKHRELLQCSSCMSSPRLRGVVHAVQRELLQDTETPLSAAAPQKSLRGVGMSDWTGYADALARLFDYTNTFYHQEPLLDVTNTESAAKFGGLDFVISSDVLEHVVGPVSQALINIRHMLKDDGVLILTVPYLEGYETFEHFPHLHAFEIVSANGDYYLENRRRDGSVERFDRLCFHGGPGSVLEMRIFGEGDLFAMLAYAGFACEVLKPSNESIGYVWDDMLESVLYRDRRTKGYVLICRPTAQ